MRNILWIGLIAAAVAAAGCDSGSAPTKPAEKTNNPAPPVAAETGQEAPNATAPATPSPVPSESASSPAAAPESQYAGPFPFKFLPVKGPMVDNSRCHVCHGNYEDEGLSVTHAQANVGCERCHGPSDDHCGDEGNITPPSILYATSRIDRACKKCHPDDLSVEGAAFCFAIIKPEDAKKRCTDCHGQHYMFQRTVYWDRTTRELLPKGQKPPD